MGARILRFSSQRPVAGAHPVPELPDQIQSLPLGDKLQFIARWRPTTLRVMDGWANRVIARAMRDHAFHTPTQSA